MQRLIFEMETSDPDDFLTLLWLADHPDVDLRAVVVTPGARDQCQLVRWGLDRCGRQDVPIGCHAHPWPAIDGTPRVSAFHYKVYGDAVRDHPPGYVWWGPELIYNQASIGSGLTVLVGSPPKNLGEAFRTYGAGLAGCDVRWVQQGGFAGDNLVEPEHRLPKFAGRVTCPSWNPGGDPRSTQELLGDPRITRRLFVSKNVCHGVVWTQELQAALEKQIIGQHMHGGGDHAWREGLRVMAHGFDCYLRDKGVGKAMHDLVAATCAIDESVCTFREVEVYRERGEWGARETAGTNTFISTAADMERFVTTLAR